MDTIWVLRKPFKDNKIVHMSFRSHVITVEQAKQLYKSGFKVCHDQRTSLRKYYVKNADRVSQFVNDVLYETSAQAS